MVAERNPYAAPAEDAGTEAAHRTRSSGPSLLARLWVVGLVGPASIAGIAALGMRAFAWEPRGADPALISALLNMHVSLMLSAVCPGAVMACAVFAVTRLQPQRMLGAAGLGIAGWAAWATASVLLWLLARGNWAPINYSLGLLALALAATGGSVAWAATRRGSDVSARDVWLVRILALACAGLSVAFVLHLVKAISLAGLDAACELVPVAAASAVALLARKSASGSHVGSIYGTAGVAPSVIITLGIRAVLEVVAEDTMLDRTFVVVAQHHAAGSSILCGLLAIGHSSFGALRRLPFREWPARVVALLVCTGLVGTSVAMYLLGSRGMPMRYASYLPQMAPHQHLVTVFSLAAALALVLVPLAALVPGPSGKESAR